MHFDLPMRAAALMIAALFLGACSSGGSSSGSSNESSGIEVDFPLGQVGIGEDIGLVIATVMLSEAAEEDLNINFVTLSAPFGTPTATFNLDFQVITPSPVLIPAGDLNASISIVILEDGLGELDEGFILRLVGSPNVDIGSANDFFVTIQDNDANPFTETEPNDPFDMPNTVGAIDEGIAHAIEGDIVAFTVDYFSLTAAAATDVSIELTPVGLGADVVLTIVDPMTGTDITNPVNQNGPGEPEELLYPAVAGEEFLIEVANTGTGADYNMRVVGLAPVNPLVPPAPVSTSRTRLWISDLATGETISVEETVITTK
ncbi:MAG: hypothetical protein GY711_07855 [bacterium]|nr:hypothetical protein [bacterium]